MRTMLRINGCAAMLLALAVYAQAQAPQERTVTVPEVEVRSGPSDAFYPTSKLKQGDKVVVVTEKNGFLVINPPAGSFNWIPKRVIKPLGSLNATVETSDVPTSIGSARSGAPPTKVSEVKLKQGTAVTLLDNSQQTDQDGSIWLPILPPPQDVRYIPANAVAAVNPVSATGSIPGGPTTVQAAQN